MNMKIFFAAVFTGLLGGPALFSASVLADGGPDPVRIASKTETGMSFRYFRATYEQLRDREFCGLPTTGAAQPANPAACKILQDTSAARNRLRRQKVWAWPVEGDLHPAMSEDGMTYFGTACICTENSLPACNAFLPKTYDDPIKIKIALGESLYKNVACYEVTWDAETVLYFVE